MKKKILSILLSMLLVLGMALPVYGTEAEPVLACTRSFLEAMDEMEIEYIYMGVEENGEEYVCMPYESGHFGSMTLDFFFNGEYSEIEVYVWYIVTELIEDRNQVLEAVNALNSTFRYAKFYLDDDDTITCEMEAFFTEDEDAGIIALMMTYSLLSILEDEEALELLGSCGKKLPEPMPVSGDVSTLISGVQSTMGWGSM